LLVDDARRRPGPVGDLIDELNRQGRVVCVFGGAPEEFVATRRAFRALRPGTPVVYSDIFSPIRPHLLDRLLTETGADQADVFLLTDSFIFATSAARLGVRGHWIAPGADQASPTGVVRHASLSKFKESLSD